MYILPCPDQTFDLAKFAQIRVVAQEKKDFQLEAEISLVPGMACYVDVDMDVGTTTGQAGMVECLFQQHLPTVSGFPQASDEDSIFSGHEESTNCIYRFPLPLGGIFFSLFRIPWNPRRETKKDVRLAIRLCI